MDYIEIARKEEARTGIHRIAIIAQAALESGYGEHAPGNNFFGIKADKKWKGDKQLLRTTEYHSTPNKEYPVILSVKKVTINGVDKFKYKIKDWFRKYASVEEGWADHSDFFFQNKRYAEALRYKSDPLKFIQEIIKAGYATDGKYISSITGLIDYYNHL